MCHVMVAGWKTGMSRDGEVRSKAAVTSDGDN
jgi:hypothetical protein